MQTITDPPMSDEDRVGGPIVGGVAYEIAGRLGVDPLWPRLTFVALTLFGGLGIVAYVGLWLMLVVALRPRFGWSRFVGGALLVGGVWFVLTDGRSEMWSGPLAVAAVLGGVALSFWQPRTVPHLPNARSAGAASVPADGSTRPAGSEDLPDAGVEQRPFPLRRRREPSPLGRFSLGVALIVAAAGAAIDQLNGGRFHPEQWLGGSAVVCGIGTLIGAWRGRAVWLLVPGAIFAAGGFVAGHAARAGVSTLDWGDEWHWIRRNTPGVDIKSQRIAGTTHLNIEDVPGNGPIFAEMRVGMGSVDLQIDDDVTVEIQPELHDGGVHGFGASYTPGGPFTVGPEGPPDVVVHVEISRGDLRFNRFEMAPPRRPPKSKQPTVPAAELIDLGGGVTMARDGTVLLPGTRRGSVAGTISPDGSVWTRGSTQPREDGVVVVDAGRQREFLVLPNQMVITPSSKLLDVPALRSRLVDPLSETPTTAVTRGNAPPVTAAPTSSPAVTSRPITSTGG